LRGRVRLRTDGGLKTGRDIIIAALLGAEEFGFGTGALIAFGCDMARQCHLNTCPTGIATQRADLRAKFTGTPEQVVHFLSHIAFDTRELLAKMGARSIEEIVGRSSLLRQRTLPNHPRANLLDLTPITTDIDPSRRHAHRNEQPRNDRPVDAILDDQLLEAAEPALAGAAPVSLSVEVHTAHRTVGARLSGEIARRHGDVGLPEGTLTLNATGSAGQSFGAFLAPGVTLNLVGESNDYVGKGMHGGTISVSPSPTASFTAHRTTIIGNTVLYGATGGRLFVAGRAGERFAVRNSGAHAVVEGVGDHGCEYMTGGAVVVLGETGRNFAAGMSAGVAYVLDEDGQFPSKVNRDMVGLERLQVGSPGEATLHKLIRAHAGATGSERATDILRQWSRFQPQFWIVVPRPPQIDTTILPTRVAARVAATAVPTAVSIP
jgi:glutamate synthase domain-containing protein 3